MVKNHLSCGKCLERLIQCAKVHWKSIFPLHLYLLFFHASSKFRLNFPFDSPYASMKMNVERRFASRLIDNFFINVYCLCFVYYSSASMTESDFLVLFQRLIWWIKCDKIRFRLNYVSTHLFCEALKLAGFVSMKALRVIRCAFIVTKCKMKNNNNNERKKKKETKRSNIIQKLFFTGV